MSPRSVVEVHVTHFGSPSRTVLSNFSKKAGRVKLISFKFFAHFAFDSALWHWWVQIPAWTLMTCSMWENTRSPTNFAPQLTSYNKNQMQTTETIFFTRGTELANFLHANYAYICSFLRAVNNLSCSNKMRRRKFLWIQLHRSVSLIKSDKFLFWRDL